MVPSHVRQHIYDCVDCRKSDPIKWIQKGAVGPPLDQAKITHSAAQQGLGLKLTRSCDILLNSKQDDYAPVVYGGEKGSSTEGKSVGENCG